MFQRRIELLSSRLTDVGPIATRMREADRIECAGLGRTPKDALRAGLRLSMNPLTAFVDGRPEAMMGVVPLSMLGGRGLVWMLGTDVVYREKRALALLGPRLVADWLGTFRCLENLVSVDNHRAIRFLTHIGFHVGGPVRHHGGVAFVRFAMTRAIQGVPATV